MASETQHTKAIVLKKTKLSETDLILTLLSEKGEQIRAVAKGARKPSSVFATRLELFSNVDVLLAKGKNLDIVREVKLLKSFTKIKQDIEKIVCASPALEILEKTTQQNMISENLYPMTLSFLKEVEKMNSSYYLKALCTAHLIKTCSIIGFRPSLATCVICGDEMEDSLKNYHIPLNFSIEDGGIVCLRCSKKTETYKINSTTIKLIHDFIHAKFEDIKMMTISQDSINDTLIFCKKWILYHVGTRMKSLDFYMKNI